VKKEENALLETL